MAREMEIAREVQAGLFPQKLPAMKTLEYTGGCIPARAVGAHGEEFGESRLVDTLRFYCHLPMGPLLQAVVGAVQQFSAGEQQDDITIVIARSLA